MVTNQTEDYQLQPDPVADHPQAGMHIWGWTSPAELEWLGNQAAQMSSVVEVGVLRGRSAFALLTACDGLVYCIDPWDDEYDQGYPAFMADCGHFPNLRAIRGYSPDAGAVVPTPVDMVWIDGAHDRASVEADIDYWLPRTTKLLCGHDYSNTDGFPDVRAVVDEKFGDRVEPALLRGWTLEESSIWTVRP